MSVALLRAGWAGSQAAEFRGESHYYPHLIDKDRGLEKLSTFHSATVSGSGRDRTWTRWSASRALVPNHRITRSLSMYAAPFLFPPPPQCRHPSTLRVFPSLKRLSWRSLRPELSPHVGLSGTTLYCHSCTKPGDSYTQATNTPV